MQKVAAIKRDQDWDKCLGQILGGYRRRPGTYGKHPFEILFEMKPRFSFKAPLYGPIATNGKLILKLEIALVKSLRAYRIVPYTPTKWPNKFEVGDTVLVRGGRRKPGSKIISPAWYGPSSSRPRVTQDRHCVQINVEDSDAPFTHAD